jgi:two-component system response regulator FixJ
MSRNSTVYLVDDDDAVRDSLSVLFGVEGLTVRSFASGQALLDDLPRLKSGCVVTDIHMAGMSGLQLLRRLRAHGVTLPVILITGRSDATLTAGAEAAGATVLIEKPFGPGEIVSAVRQALTENAAPGAG